MLTRNNFIDMFNDLEQVHLALSMAKDDAEFDIKHAHGKKTNKYWKRRLAAINHALAAVERLEKLALSNQ